MLNWNVPRLAAGCCWLLLAWAMKTETCYFEDLGLDPWEAQEVLQKWCLCLSRACGNERDQMLRSKVDPYSLLI